VLQGDDGACEWKGATEDIEAVRNLTGKAYISRIITDLDVLDVEFRRRWRLRDPGRRRQLLVVSLMG